MKQDVHRFYEACRSEILTHALYITHNEPFIKNVYI